MQANTPPHGWALPKPLGHITHHANTARARWQMAGQQEPQVPHCTTHLQRAALLRQLHALPVQAVALRSRVLQLQLQRRHRLLLHQGGGRRGWGDQGRSDHLLDSRLDAPGKSISTDAVTGRISTAC